MLQDNILIIYTTISGTARLKAIMTMVLVIKTSLLDSSAIHRRSQHPFAEEDEYVSNHMTSNDQNQAFENAVQELIDSISGKLA
jgi:hypothetical protein